MSHELVSEIGEGRPIGRLCTLLLGLVAALDRAVISSATLTQLSSNNAAGSTPSSMAEGLSRSCGTRPHKSSDARRARKSTMEVRLGGRLGELGEAALGDIGQLLEGEELEARELKLTGRNGSRSSSGASSSATTLTSTATHRAIRVPATAMAIRPCPASAVDAVNATTRAIARAAVPCSSRERRVRAAACTADGDGPSSAQVKCLRWGRVANVLDEGGVALGEMCDNRRTWAPCSACCWPGVGISRPSLPYCLTARSRSSWVISVPRSISGGAAGGRIPTGGRAQGGISTLKEAEASAVAQTGGRWAYRSSSIISGTRGGGSLPHVMCSRSSSSPRPGRLPRPSEWQRHD